MPRFSPLATAIRLLAATVVVAATVATSASPAAAAVTPTGTNPTTPSNTAVAGTVTFTPTAAESIAYYDQSGPTASGNVAYDAVTGGTPGQALTIHYTYTPNTNFRGTDSDEFRVQACGMTGCADVTHTEFFTVTNQGPVVTGGGVYTTPADTPITINGTATDPEGDGTFFVDYVSNPPNGSYTGGGLSNTLYSLTYLPDPGYSGTEALFVTYRDGLGAHTTVPISITVTQPPNSPPVAVADDYNLDEGASITGNVLDNDTDADFDTLTIAGNTAPAHAETFTLNADGSFAYIPHGEWSGTATFTYSATDGTDTSATVTVTFTVAPVNDAPVAVDDAYSTPSGTELVVDAPGIFANDTDADAGDTFQLVETNGPTNGTIDANGSTGSFTYTPDAGFRGTDSFTYMMTDGNGGFSNDATVTITVDNAAPVAVADDYTLDEDSTETGNVLANDSDVNDDTVTVASHTEPAHAALFTLADDGTFSYTPNEDFSGTDAFTYTPTDGTNAGNTVTVTFTVEAVNDAPVGDDAAVATDEDTAVSGTVTATDADDTNLEYAIAEAPASGALLLDPATGDYTYTPAQDFNGEESFTVEITDPAGAVGTATITVTVTAVNDAPVATDGTLDSPHNTITTISMDDYVTDVDDTELTYELSVYPTNGTVELDADGLLTYTPAADWHGTDTFAVQVCDPAMACDTATFTVTVSPADEVPAGDTTSNPTGPTGPVQVGETVTLNGGGSTAADGGGLTYAWTQVGGPDVELTGANAATASFVPDGAGTFVFSLTVCDSDGVCDTETVEVAVLAADGAPIPVTARPATPTTAPRAELPKTGTGPIAMTLGLTLLGLGVGITALSRRRLGS